MKLLGGDRNHCISNERNQDHNDNKAHNGNAAHNDHSVHTDHKTHAVHNDHFDKISAPTDNDRNAVLTLSVTLLEAAMENQFSQEEIARVKMIKLPSASGKASFRQNLFLQCHPVKVFKNAYFLATLSAFFLALYGMLYEVIKKDIARATVTVSRGIMQLLMNFIVSLILRERLRILRPNELKSSLLLLWTFFLLVALFGGLRLSLNFSALQLTEMSIVNTILNGNPVLVMVLGHFMLSGEERMTWVKVFSAVLLIAGIFLTANPITAVHNAITNKDYESVVGIALAVLALVFSALGSVYTKLISRHFSQNHISAAIGVSIAAFGMLSVLSDPLVNSMQVLKANRQFVSGQNSTALTALLPMIDQLKTTNISCAFAGRSVSSVGNLTAFVLKSNSSVACQVFSPPYFPADARVWSIAIAVGVMGLGQQYSLIASIKQGSPSRVSMVRSSSIFITFLLQCLVSVIPSWNQWLGAVVILAAIFVSTLEEQASKCFGAIGRKICCCCSRELDMEEEAVLGSIPSQQQETCL